MFLHCSWPIQPNPSHLRTGPVTRPRPTSARPRWGPAPWPPASARPTKRPGSWPWGRQRRPRCSPGVAGRPGDQPWFRGDFGLFGGFLKGWGHLAKFGVKSPPNLRGQGINMKQAMLDPPARAATLCRRKPQKWCWPPCPGASGPGRP